MDLAINGYYDKTLIVVNGNIKKDEKQNISSSASECDVHLTAMDAERHSFPNSERLKQKANTAPGKSLEGGAEK